MTAAEIKTCIYLTLGAMAPLSKEEVIANTTDFESVPPEEVEEVWNRMVALREVKEEEAGDGSYYPHWFKF